jgi:hypothetical protein
MMGFRAAEFAIPAWEVQIAAFSFFDIGKMMCRACCSLEDHVSLG